MTADAKNILIVKPSALGDIVHALPVLGAVRAARPDAHITWLVRREFAPLLECVDGLDDILLFDRKQLGRWFWRPAAAKALLNFLRTLKNSRYDLVLDLQGLFRTAFFARLTGCPRRIGMADSREFAGLFYTRKVPRPADSLHVLDYYFALLDAAGIHADPTADVSFKISAPAAASIHQKLQRAGVTGGYLVLVPSSAHPNKCWPPERFAALAEQLNRRYSLDIVIIGTARDKPVIDAIAARTDLHLADLSGRTDITELLALLVRARGVVANDTGPGHIAAAMRVPTVLVFGHTNPMRVGPYHRPECIAAVDPQQRPDTIESRDPAHRIENVPLAMVLDKITAQLNTAEDPDKR